MDLLFSSHCLPSSALVIHRADFQRLLYQAALRYNVQFLFSTRISYEAIVRDPDNPQMRDILSADIIIAADGTSFHLPRFSATRPWLIIL